MRRCISANDARSTLDSDLSHSTIMTRTYNNRNYSYRSMPFKELEQFFKCRTRPGASSPNPRGQRPKRKQSALSCIVFNKLTN